MHSPMTGSPGSGSPGSPNGESRSPDRESRSPGDERRSAGGESPDREHSSEERELAERELAERELAERELAELGQEIDAVERRAARSVELGGRAVVLAVLVFVLIVGQVLPWLGGATGIEVLLGTGTGDAVGKPSMVPRLFAATSVLFGVLASALALSTRWWALTWVCALGGWFASVDGILAIWSRQSSGGDVGIGLVIAWVATVAIAILWFRTAWSRPHATADAPE